MESFVIIGKASTVFKLIEFKAKYAEKTREDLKQAKENLKEFVSSIDLTCPFKSGIVCTKPRNKTCAQICCLIWKEIDGE